MRKTTLFKAVSCWLLAIGLILGTELYATDIDQRFSEAQAKYDTKDYEGAINGYQSLLAEGHEGFELFYNLGNAHYRLDHIGEAVLYFEKAVKLSPYKEDAQFNLKLARQRVQDRFAEAPDFLLTRIWRGVRDFALPASWFWTAIGLCWLLCMYQAWVWYKNPDRRFGIAKTAMILGVVVIALLALGLDRQKVLEKDTFAILLSNNLAAREVPDEQSSNSFELHEGIKVEIVDELNGWWQVELPDGRKGWVKPDTWGRI